MPPLKITHMIFLLSANAFVAAELLLIVHHVNLLPWLQINRVLTKGNKTSALYDNDVDFELRHVDEE